MVLLTSVLFHTKKPADPAVLSLACSGVKNADKSCWESLFAKTLKEYGVDGALDLLAYAYDTTQAVEDSTCHDLTHFIGRQAFTIFARGKKFPVSAKTAYCNYGFYHGVMEGMVEKKKPLSDAKKFCDYIDGAIGKEAPEAFLQCYHGIGHGTVNNHDPKTWGNEQAMLTPALTICDAISQNREERWRCASGAFHGLGQFYREQLYNLKIRKEDPFWFCKTQTRDEYKETCYREMTATLGMVVQDGDFLRIADVINTIGEDQYATETMIAWGVPYKESVSYRPVGINFCRRLPARLSGACVKSIARQMIQAGTPGDELADAIEYCGSTMLTKGESTNCFDFVFFWNSRWIPSPKRENNCKKVAIYFQSQCYRLIQKK